MNEISFDEALSKTAPEFKDALKWFADHTGTEISWPNPSPVAGLEHVVTKAKGIFKPAGFDIALSLKIVIGSPYADIEPVVRPDGTWVCAYHQEGTDPYRRDDEWTNRALMKNLATNAPIFLLRQIKEKPHAKYLIQGIAIVTGWENGLFFLEGFNQHGFARTSPSESILDVMSSEIPQLVREIPNATEEDTDFALDARRRVNASIVVRQGSGPFRKGLLEAYQGRCAISACSLQEVLDAAHIRPYRGRHTNETKNGLLLRTDLHSLFDRGLIAIHPTSRRIILASKLLSSEYAIYDDQILKEPSNPVDRPSNSNLKAHLDWCREQIQ